ncbi:MAG: Tol-Pal system protein TolB, partial [Pseudomonadota bacterium]
MTQALSRLVAAIGLCCVLLGWAGMAAAQSGEAVIDVTPGGFEPIKIAVAPFIAQDAGLTEVAGDMVAVTKADLERSGLFTLIPEEAFI